MDEENQNNLFVSHMRLREVIRLKAFTALLKQALFTFILSDLNHIVLSPSPTFVGVDGDFVAVPANLGPGVGS